MYTLNYVFDSELKADSPPESAGILEFWLIPADSLDSARIPGGISGGMKSIEQVLKEVGKISHRLP